jgi:anaerobic ribonucleoside-triphosphate reductase activating protein
VCIAINLWEFDKQYEVALQDIKDIIRYYKMLQPDLALTFSGGDPFFQPELAGLLAYCKQTLKIDDILVYTGFTLEEIRLSKKAWMQESLNFIDVLIDGKYYEDLNDNAPLRGSSNQKIHYLNPTMEVKYAPVLSGPRLFEIKIQKNDFDIYGVVPKDFIKNFKEKTKKLGLDLNLPV